MKIKFLYIVALLIVGCASKQKSVENIESKIVRDSTVFVERVKPIQDSIVIAVSPVASDINNASDCQKELERILKSLSYSKHSGDNSFKIEYDSINKLLHVLTRLEEQKNTQTIVKNDNQKIQTKTHTVHVPFVPQWAKVLSGIGLVFIIYGIIKIYKRFFA